MRAVVLLLALFPALVRAAEVPPAAPRTFSFTYSVLIRGVPVDARQVRLWLPVPPDSREQKIEGLRFEVAVSGRAAQEFTPEQARVALDPASGNRMAHFVFDGNEATGTAVRMTFRCTRQETRPGNLENVRELTAREKTELGPYLAADRLVPVGGRFQPTAETATAGAHLPLEIARAAYDYTVRTMKYDKPPDLPGWGQGSTQWACDARLGNCTDFHALLMSLCRSKGIPIKFEMGFSLPERNAADPKTAAGPIAGYHCWVQLYLSGAGWMGADASEANKHPALRDYYFGHLTPDRVHFTTGRDLNLVPRQTGEPLNFFIYPYAEADGQPLSVERGFAFEDQL